MSIFAIPFDERQSEQGGSEAFFLRLMSNIGAERSLTRLKEVQEASTENKKIDRVDSEKAKG